MTSKSPTLDDLFALAKAQFFNRELDNARATIENALRLDPNDTDFWHLLGHLEFYQENYPAALTAAERGLELQPESTELLNLRSQVLIKLNRPTDAAQTLDYALNRNPEDASAHANRGWVNIESGDLDDALQNFRNALRLRPDDAFAREGLKEAIRGKNVLYRQVQRYFLWASKMQEKYQWGFIIGLYVLYRALLALAESQPALSAFIYPLIVLYILFAFSTWIAVPVSNLFLRFHPLGKLALDRDEITGSNLAGALLLGCLLNFGLYIAGLGDLFLLLGGFFGLMLLPACGTFAAPAGTQARRYLSLYAWTLFLMGAVWFFVPVDALFYGFLIGFFAFQFVSPYLIRRELRRF